MTERNPLQITDNLVLCDDGTLWKYNGVSWIKIPPIPTDEEYEVQQEKRLKWEKQRIGAQTERWRNEK